MIRTTVRPSRRGRAMACGIVWAVLFPPFSAHAAAPAAPGMANAARIADWQAVILARPLFSRTRRPEAAPDVSASVPRLAGIVVSLGRRRAIFMTPGAGRGQVVDAGATVGPWRVLAIGVDSVRVTGAGGAQTLRPDRDRSADGKAGAPPPGLSQPGDQKPEDQIPGGTQ
ncbi:hypothetical protein AA13595_2625 [Gluconacetobacter johannae DSM 13595]|uniref:general secretion pathway protein GspN n=1 Tax=Gluconacetobacter johannae TaxID=112140 RepID=UPI001FE7FEBC|nr:general secretion pathway protein GspN [Gluconacetobacter johannae]GBQ89366.1 hypothetical protein AA13595_2625 [Gluconacetobacter johannae DSM 13595]